ncbi:MAG: hypothetical protein A2Y55_03125 [Actinobacteria bacterium RBG_16_68_12]|nr:MAG: hypothetical protein A2Y55_03125 [Actinobacteria bacterium RBG_16_68_12]
MLDTGIRSVVFASTRTLTFRMRFCFAPTSSSPSYRRTRVGERVHDQELGHAARLARLADPKPPSERLVESEIDRDRITARVEWCDDDPAVLRVPADLEELLDHLRLLWCQAGVARAGRASYATIALHILGR